MAAGMFYITTPIYYPNGEPHLGSIYTTVICDVLARYHRLRGRRTYFLTGTDEHGTKMAKAAASAGVEPGELAGRYAGIFQDVWRELGITNDDFIRTTEPRHKDRVAKIVENLLAAGDIYLGSYSGWYDESQEEFVTETEAKKNDYKSAISRKPLTRYVEPSYFFRLSRYVPKVLAHIEAHPQFIRPESRRNEVTSKLRAGVDDLSISRATLKWGIRMPNDPEHVLYVWIDALSNYVTALGHPALREGDDALFREFWPADVHVIGKDILWFHTVYWPAMLMSLGLPLPATVAAHGWWVNPRTGGKGGKTTGGITTLHEIRELRDRYGFDTLRYYFLRAAPFGSDLEWNLQELDKANTELANVVGNLLNRVLTMVNKPPRDGLLPAATGAVEQIDRDLRARADDLPAQLAAAYERLDLQQCALLPVEVARAANGFIDNTAPFKLAKDPTKVDRVDSILNLAAHAAHCVLLGLLPILPEKAAAGLAQLGVEVRPDALAGATCEPLRPGHRVGQGQPLFPRADAGKK